MRDALFACLSILALAVQPISKSLLQVINTPCLQCSEDSIPRQIVTMVVNGVVDSFQVKKLQELDSINTVQDSLAVEIELLKRYHKRKLFVGKIDTIPAPYPAKGQVIWRWYYWKYHTGETEYFKTTKTKIP